MSQMRAKMQINHIEKFGYTETLHLNAVSKSSYPEDGSDEDNSYARWTPSASLSILINNPALIGVFAVGQKLYVDFTKAE